MTGRAAFLPRASLDQPLPKTLHVDSKQEDPLAIYKIKGRDGQVFLAVIPVMTRRVLDDGVRDWVAGKWLKLTMTPWDQAVAARRELGTMPVVDDMQDQKLPRYLSPSGCMPSPMEASRILDLIPAQKVRRASRDASGSVKFRWISFS